MAEKDNITKFYCYAHRTADTNHVFYIGKGHGNRAYSKQRSKYWHNKANKHGHIVEIISSNLSESQSFDMEREFISFYGRDRLVNLTDGGEGPSGYKFTEEQKELHSKKIKSFFEKNPEQKMISTKNIREYCKLNPPMLNPETAKKVSISTKGKPRPWASYARSEETKNKMSESKKGISNEKTTGHLNGFAKKVICVETGVEFACIRYAKDWLKSIKKSGNIVCCLNGWSKTAGGFNWKYADK